MTRIREEDWLHKFTIKFGYREDATKTLLGAAAPAKLPGELYIHVIYAVMYSSYLCIKSLPVGPIGNRLIQLGIIYCPLQLSTR